MFRVRDNRCRSKGPLHCHSTNWGVRLFKRFGRVFHKCSTGHKADTVAAMLPKQSMDRKGSSRKTFYKTSGTTWRPRLYPTHMQSSSSHLLPLKSMSLPCHVMEWICWAKTACSTLLSRMWRWPSRKRNTDTSCGDSIINVKQQMSKKAWHIHFLPYIQGASGGREPVVWLTMIVVIPLSAPILLGQTGIWQNWPGNWARWWNIIQIKVNPTEVRDHQWPCVSGIFAHCALTVCAHNHKEPLRQTRTPHEDACAEGQPLKTSCYISASMMNYRLSHSSCN